MQKKIETVCSYKKCSKKFLAEATRFSNKSKHKPKFCSHYCYGQSRILPAGEARARRNKRCAEYFKKNYFKFCALQIEILETKPLRQDLTKEHNARVMAKRKVAIEKWRGILATQQV